MAEKKQQFPFDPVQMMEDYWKMFDPKKQTELFDPKKFMESMKSFAPQTVDFQAVYERNQQNFEGVMKANEAAAQTYRSMLENQMEILNRVSQEARDLAVSDDKAAGDVASQYSQAYSRAMELGLSLMKEMAEEVQKANEEVYERYQKRLSETVGNLKSK